MSVCRKITSILRGHKGTKNDSRSSPYCGTELSVLCGALCGGSKPRQKEQLYEEDVSTLGPWGGGEGVISELRAMYEKQMNLYDDLIMGKMAK